MAVGGSNDRQCSLGIPCERSSERNIIHDFGSQALEILTASL